MGAVGCGCHRSGSGGTTETSLAVDT
uniref:Uncharacterized protein n=1 Tax=Arundo donax TaxID=35708 RepID=A0A0A9UEX8_ARUDO